MNAIIDLTNMTFVYAHENTRLLSSLAHIELMEVGTLVCDATYQGTYARFTDLELKLLYKNTFGTESFFGRGACIQVLMDNARDLPQADVDAYEALVQANSIAEDDETPYRYQRGSMKPLALDEAYAPPPLRLRPPVLGDKPFKPADKPSGALFVGRDYSGAQAPQAPAGPERTAASTKVAAAPREPRAPGGARPRIFEVADAMWAAAGSPRDLPTVLNLRKQMMTALEAEGIKRTTSSTALGEWQKTRLA
jgi:hypothetical protein